MLAIIACSTLQAQSTDATASPSPERGEFYHHWRGHHHSWIWRKLNLTDQQKGQVKSIRQNMKGQIRPALAAVLKARLQLNQDIDAGKQDAIANDSSTLATAQTQLATLRATQWTQIKGILTADQLNTLNSFKEKMQTRTLQMIDKLSQPAS
jgi:Spy/CpxP family protein refolding chaperone